MPRVSIRKAFIYLLAAASVALLVLNIHQTLVGHFGAITPTGIRGGSAATAPSARGAFPWELEESGPGGGKSGRRKPNADKNKRDSHSSSLQQELDETTTAPPIPRKAFDRRTLLDPADTRPRQEKERPWYMRNGELQPQTCPVDPATRVRQTQFFPEEAPEEDRIPEQLMFVPPQFSSQKDQEAVPLKKILLWNGISSWGGNRPGRGAFLKEKCPVNACALTTSRSDFQSADLVLFKDHFTMPTVRRPKHQLWMLYMLECPLHTQMFKAEAKSAFNFTATYRHDSTLVAPYERWQYHNENVRSLEQKRDMAANKTRAVAWFVSNCGARNGRLQYAKELAKHIQVDIYGSCGTKKCPRSQSKNCFSMLDKDYKFYLAFENSNCKDYITEKFFVNGLG